MKYLIRILTSLAILSIMGACGGKGSDDTAAQIDSLRSEAELRTRQYDELSEFVTTVALSLDSIAQGENMIVSVINPEKGVAQSREIIRERVKEYAELISRQKQRIAALTESLHARKGANGIDPQMEIKLNSMIEYLNAQLASKDQQLAQLQAQLASSKASIAQLNQTVGKLKSNVSSLEKEVTTLESTKEKLGQALTAQDEVINECYLKVGTKKELEAAGILQGGGFLRKKKINYNSFSSAGFKKVDIRNFTHLAISGKKVKLLTSAPNGSYSVKKVGDKEWELIIRDPTRFWSISNYLVIQTD